MGRDGVGLEASPGPPPPGPDGRRRQAVAWCLLLLLLAVVSRLVYLHHFGVESQEGGDMGEYIALARHLASGDGFTFDGLSPATYRPPLFSCLLAGWCWLLGDTRLGAMVAFQVVVQSLAAPLAYLLVRAAQRSHRWAIGCGFLMSVYPYLISTVSLVLQEPTLTLIATLTGIAFVSWCRTPSLSRAVATGACLGLSALGKSPFLAGPIVVLLVGWVFRRHPRCPPWRQVVLAAAVSAAVIVPWTLRNALVAGRFVPINSQGAGAVIWMVADGHFRARETPSDPIPQQLDPEQGVGFTYGNEDGVAYLLKHNEDLLRQGVSGSGIERGLEAAARSYLVRHPLYVLRLLARGMILMAAPYAVGPLREHPRVRLAAMVLIHLPLAIGFAVGLLRSWREHDAAIAMLSLIATLYLLAHSTVVAEGGRYAAPLLPAAMAIAGYGFFGGQVRGVGRAGR